MADENKQRAHLVELLKKMENSLARIYGSAYKDVLKLAEVRRAIEDGGDFTWKGHPEAARQLEAKLAALARQTEQLVKNGTSAAWDIAHTEGANVSFGGAIGKADKAVLDNTIHKATESARKRGATAERFNNERHGGLTISGRVWKTTRQSKEELEAIIQSEIAQGHSADQAVMNVRKYLLQPNEVPKFVKGPDGKYIPNSAWNDYKPGTGVYKSAYQNARRLAVTEVNMAYRQAEIESYRSNPLVVGYEVKTSGNHVDAGGREICECLAGKYPKTFMFTGWHPQCRCYIKPITCTRDEFREYQQAIKDGNEAEWRPKSLIDKTPDNLNEWIAINKDRIEMSTNLPFFIRDNYKIGRDANGELKLTLNSEIEQLKETVEEQKRRSILEKAKERHQKRTEKEKQEIVGRWNERKAEIEKKRSEAIAAIKEANEYSVDASNLKKLLEEYKFNTIQDEIQNVLNKIEEVKEQENALSDLIPNVHEWHKTITLEELGETYSAVKKKIDSWSSLSLEQQAKKLEFEAVDFLGGNMNSVQEKYPKTWKVSQSAYFKKLDEVNLKIAVKKIGAELSDIKKWYWNHKKAIKLGKLLTDAFDAISASSDLTLIQQKAQLVRDEYEKKKAEYAKRTKVNSKEIIFSEDNFTKARKDNAVWDTGNGQTADDTLIDEAARVWKSATEDEKNYTFEYTRHFCDVNEPLQGRKYGNYQTKERFTEKVNNITSYIDKSELPKDMWFTRGDSGMFVIESRIKFAGGTMPSDIKDLVGMVMQEGGFMSSASRKGKGFNTREVILNIYAPKGTKAVYIEPFSAYGRGAGRKWRGDERFYSFSGEQETLFQRGTKMRITKVYEEKSKIYIDCEVIGQEIKDLSYVKDSDIGW